MPGHSDAGRSLCADGSEHLRALLRKYAGQTATVEVICDRKPVTLTMALPARPQAGGHLEQLEDDTRRLESELRWLREWGDE